MTDPGPPPTRLHRTRVRPTRRGVLLAALGLFLYAAGANVAAGWVLVLSAACLGALPWAWWSAWRAAGRVEVRRVLPARATAGVETELGLRVSAPTAAAAVVVDVASDAVAAVRGLATGATMHAPARLPRGSTVRGEVTVELADPLGLVSAQAYGMVDGRCLVVPAVPDVDPTETPLRWAGALDGSARRAGDGVEVLGVRDYRHGDALRAVHWRSTARTGQLVVREFTDDARPTVAVHIAGGRWEAASLDLAIEAACGLADGFVRRGHPTTIGIDGASLAWNDATRVQLATVPPTRAATDVSTMPRVLAGPPGRTADLLVEIGREDAGVGVTAVGRDRSHHLGVMGAATPDVGAWLSIRLAALGEPR